MNRETIIFDTESNDSPLVGLQLAFEQFNLLSQNLDSSVSQLNQTALQMKANIGEPSNAIIDEGIPQNLIDAIPGGILILDPQGRIVAINKSVRDIIESPVLDQMWRDVVSREFHPELDHGELKTMDGRQFSISTQPLGYRPGQVLLLNDVTATRQLQKATQQNQHLSNMGKMMASLAHQIRTPLASSMLYLSQIVDDQSLDGSSHKFCKKALDRVHHIETLINDMLVFAHGGEFKTRQFDLSELFQQVKDQLVPIAHRMNASLFIICDLPDVQLHGNKDALLGALANIVMNGLQATSKNGVVSVKASLTRRGLLSISIRDNGCGMESNTRRHLFDPFFTTKEEGTGLGMAVVKSVIESHQGKIAVASRLNKGTRFRIFLPCQKANKMQLSGSD